MSAWRLEIFLARRTLLRTRRTMTSATVELRRDPKGAARRGVADLPVSFRRFAAFAPGGGCDRASRFLVVVAAAVVDPLFPSVVAVATAGSAPVLSICGASVGMSPCWEFALFVAVAVALEVLSTVISPSSKLL